MNENTKQAIEYAYDDDMKNMQTAIEDSIREKIAAAFMVKKAEIAQTLVTSEDHCCPKELTSKQKKFMDVDDDEDIDEKDLEKLRKKKKLKKEDVEDLDEKLNPSMGAEKYVHDFAHSDNPKFEGKSKKERIQMALGAYYSAKKGKTKN